MSPFAPENRRLMKRPRLCVVLLFLTSIGLLACPAHATHSADYQPPAWHIDLTELLRVIQFFNIGGLHCGAGTEDGYSPGSGAPINCAAHQSDYSPQDWKINLSELLRLIQFFNFRGYHTAAGTEDGYAPGYPTPNPGEEKTFAGIPFVWIPEGTFSMGSSKTPEEIRNLYGGDAAWYTCENPLHPVTITQGFWMGQYEITQEQFKAQMGENPSFNSGDHLPVETLSWNDCQSFVAKLNTLGEGVFRLPTEAEWEYACRAGTQTEYCYGDSMATLGEYAWFFTNSNYETQEVGKKTPNAWNLYDMHGNVWEWCQDWYKINYYSESPIKDPQGPTTGSYHILRGGTCKRTEPKCRSAFRSYNSPSFPTADQGMRVCRQADFPKTLNRMTP